MKRVVVDRNGIVSIEEAPVADSFALGYSNAGRVLAVGDGVAKVQPGDRVACAGWGMALHAERTVVPVNLCNPLPDGVTPREAALNALGAVCIHAVHRSQTSWGETVVVLGQGLLGQLCQQLVRIAGARSVVTAKYPLQARLAEELGADLVLDADDENIERKVKNFTRGIGADRVIISVGGDMSEPFRVACRIVRDEGTITLLGRGRVSFVDADFYAREATLVSVRALGPGRHDPAYEELGQDYPVGYVRWTEGRNAEEYLRLVGEGKLKVSPLITHEFPFERAAEAYETILRDRANTVAVLFSYGRDG